MPDKASKLEFTISNKTILVDRPNPLWMSMFWPTNDEWIQWMLLRLYLMAIMF